MANELPYIAAYMPIINNTTLVLYVGPTTLRA